MARDSWISIRGPLSARKSSILTFASFVLPLVLWCGLSYVPFVWHPFVVVTDPGGVDYFQPGMLIERPVFDDEAATAAANGLAKPQGTRANPIYFPAPHEVATALYKAFKTPPRLPSEPWLHESLWHSIKIIAWGFVLSSLVGIPLGILCGTIPFFSRLHEPFVEFFRYLPAPAFGALCVAVLGIYDAPKIAIIFIGTFFQQVLVVANTTRKVEMGLLEAAQTLGASKKRLVTRVVIPSIVVDLYSDSRILLGWAWTYLIVAELVGTTSGITYFINQQARYRNYPNVYAAIMIIGFIGLGSDMVLAWLGRRMFPWQPQAGMSALTRLWRALTSSRAASSPRPARVAAGTVAPAAGSAPSASTEGAS
jgi:NitT/TauT family transport system permease protein